MTNLSTAKTMLTVSTVMIAILVVILVVVVALWMRAEMRIKRALKERSASGATKKDGGTGNQQKGYNFYFTYGTTPEYPFCGGWTLIVAEDWDAAEAAFRIYHKGESYAFAYTQDAMEKTGMLLSGNAGAFCHEKIIIEKTLHPGDRAE